MRKLVLLACVLLVAPQASAAVLCIPEAAATVKQTGVKFQAGALDTRSKFILSAESGGLSVKMHPQGDVVFANCVTEYFCDGGEMFAGAFMRSVDSEGQQVFTAIWMVSDGTSHYANTAKGFCTTI